MLLLIGNKNYSSWSLRAWLAMKVLGIAFEEKRVALYLPGSKDEILRISPSGKVPCVVDRETRVWDSLAILEYLAETHPELWPSTPAARAMARSVSAEMHSGFAGLRQHMCMNVRKRHPGKGRTPEALADIARIQSIWADCRARHAADGPFLFGRFSAADAMYAPVVLRFVTYEVELSVECARYRDTVLELPAIQEWMQAARTEQETLSQFEPYA